MTPDPDEHRQLTKNNEKKGSTLITVLLVLFLLLFVAGAAAIIIVTYVHRRRVRLAEEARLRGQNILPRCTTGNPLFFPVNGGNSAPVEVAPSPPCDVLSLEAMEEGRQSDDPNIVQLPNQGTDEPAEKVTISSYAHSQSIDQGNFVAFADPDNKVITTAAAAAGASRSLAPRAIGNDSRVIAGAVGSQPILHSGRRVHSKARHREPEAARPRVKKEQRSGEMDLSDLPCGYRSVPRPLIADTEFPGMIL